MTSWLATVSAAWDLVVTATVAAGSLECSASHRWYRSFASLSSGKAWSATFTIWGLCGSASGWEMNRRCSFLMKAILAPRLCSGYGLRAAGELFGDAPTPNRSAGFLAVEFHRSLEL